MCPPYRFLPCCTETVCSGVISLSYDTSKGYGTSNMAANNCVNLQNTSVSIIPGFIISVSGTRTSMCSLRVF